MTIEVMIIYRFSSAAYKALNYVVLQIASRIRSFFFPLQDLAPAASAAVRGTGPDFTGGLIP